MLLLMTYTTWRFYVLCGWKISFKISSIRCVKYIEKKPNLTILTGLKSKNIRFSTMVAIKWYEIATLTPAHLFAVKGGEKRGWPNRAIHLRCVWKNGIRSNIRSSRKVVLREACNLIKKWLQHKCFLGNFAEFLRTASFFREHLWWLLLYYKHSLPPHT